VLRVVFLACATGCCALLTPVVLIKVKSLWTLRIASIIVQDANPRQHITGIAEISIIFCAGLARCVAREGQRQTLSDPINGIHLGAQSGDLPRVSLRFTIHIEEAIIDSEYNSSPRLQRTEPE
jgi:hypothetical protein